MSADTGWYVARLRCHVCHKSHIAVFPAEAVHVKMECDRCHAMACKPTKFYGAKP